jgi:hypothetical protein
MLRLKERSFYKQQLLNLDEISTNNPNEFWNKVNSIGPRVNFRLPQSVNINGTLTSDKEIVSEEWRTQFSNLYKKDAVFQDPRVLNDVLEEKLTLENNMINDDHIDNEINSIFTVDEVVKFTHTLKRNKSPGIDNIPNEILGHNSVQNCLVSLFNFCFDNSLVPTDWLNANISPIPKSAMKDPYTPINYRGIALLSCVGKLYTTILNARITTFCDTNEILSDCQNGFRKNRSCQDHVFALTSIINNNRKEKKDTFCCFIDFQKFFDFIDRNLLLFKVAKIGIVGKMYWAVKSLFNNTKCRVKLGPSFYTEWFDSENGVRQGDCISPTLASIFLNDLLLELNYDIGDSIYTNVLAYADDLIILATSEEELQKLIDKTRDWCRKWQLLINVEKTQIVHFRNPRKNESNFIFKWYDTEIVKVNSYKYLGVYLDSHLNYKEHCGKIASAGGRALGKVISKFKQIKNIGFNTFKKLFENGVDPVLSYGAEIWGNYDSVEIERVQNRACRYYLGVSSLTPLPFLNGDVGWIPCKYKRYSHMIRYWNRLIKMENSRLTKKLFLRDFSNFQNNNNYIGWCKSFYSVCSELGIMDVFNALNFVNINVPQKTLDLVSSIWKTNVNSKPKLRTYKTFKFNFCTEPYVSNCQSRFKRSLIAQLRSGTLPLRIETGRHRNVKLEDRICQFCDMHVIEDEFHFVQECPNYSNIRVKLHNSVENSIENTFETNSIH